MMSKLIGVSIGDIDGIGIILLIDSWKKKKLQNFILFTNINIFKNFLRKRKIKLEINKVNYNNELKYDKLCFNVFDFNAKNKYENTLKSIDYSYKENLKKNIIGFVTLPLRKDLIKNRLDKDFVGHTEYLEKLDKANGSNMILYNKKIMVSTLTTHISVKSISRTLSKKNLKVIRTSPDHGTAYNLINSRNLSSKSLINSFKLIKNIYNNRINYEESKKIIRSKLSN